MDAICAEVLAAPEPKSQFFIAGKVFALAWSALAFLIIITS